MTNEPTVHGILGGYAARKLDVICEAPVRAGNGYADGHHFNQVTCPDCRNIIDAGYDFTTAVE